jgi:hypothetical protein
MNKKLVVHIAKKILAEDLTKFLASAFLYMKPDGTNKLCGNRCGMHIEDGPNKKRCLLFGKDLVVPKTATCNLYVKGKAADPKQPFIAKLDAKEAGFTLGPAQCKNCISANKDVSVCRLLTAILNQILDNKAEFKIQSEACCNAMRPK